MGPKSSVSLYNYLNLREKRTTSLRGTKHVNLNMSLVLRFHCIIIKLIKFWL